MTILDDRQTAQFLWVGSKLTCMEQICLSSFVATGYVVHLYSYSSIQGVPPGVIVLDACEILPSSRIFQHENGFGKGSYATFADLFRLHLLHKKGGWWFDMDFLALRLLQAPDDLTFASTWENQWGECAVNSAMWSREGDPRMALLRDRAEAIVASGDVPFGSTGPFLLQAFLREGGPARVAPWHEFCPYPWRMVERMAFKGYRGLAKDIVRDVKHRIVERIQPEFRRASVRRTTRAIHWHNEIWRQSGVDKNEVYHPLSPYGRAQRRFVGSDLSTTMPLSRSKTA